LLAAYRNYLAVVLDPGADLARRQRARAAARLARSNATVSVDRARAEPVRARGQVELGETVLAHSHRFIHAMLTIDAVRTAVHRAGRIAELDAFMAAAAAVLTGCERAVRGGTAPRSVPKLRPLQETLAGVLATDPLGDPATSSALLDASDRITNSLDTLVNELRRQLA
jgi:uncharacterized membrane protein YccC